MIDAKSIVKIIAIVKIVPSLLYNALVGSNKAKKSNSSEKMSEKKSECKGSMCESSLIEACKVYKQTRTECAVALNIQKCVEIKMGTNDAYMAQSTYCDLNGNPNLWLLK